MREAGWPLDVAVEMRAFRQRLNVGATAPQSFALLADLFDEMGRLAAAIGYGGLAARISVVGSGFRDDNPVISIRSPERLLEAMTALSMALIRYAHSCGWDIASAAEAMHVATMARRQSDGSIARDEEGNVVPPSYWRPADMGPYVQTRRAA